MSDPISQPDVIAALSHAVLEVFDEHDPARRAAAIERVFTPDVRFIDHNGARQGRAQIETAVEQLQAQLPDFRFTHAAAPQVMDGAARLSWRFGPPSEPAKVVGSDTILVRDGRVSLLLVFLDQAPQGLNG